MSPVLLEKSLAKAGVSWIGRLRIGKNEDDTSFAESISSIRFLFTDNLDPRIAGELKAKRILLDYWLVTQRWTTGQDTPSVPAVLLNGRCRSVNKSQEQCADAE